MRNYWILGLILLLMSISVGADEDYRLRIPSVEEYLRAIPEILDVGNADIDPEYGPPYFNYPVFEILVTELGWRYPDLTQVDPTLLYEAYHYLVDTNTLWAGREQYGQAVAMALLHQSDGEFGAGDILVIEDTDFEVIVTPRDYTGDGISELVLQVSSDFYSQYLVVQRVNDTYQIIQSPLPWFGRGFSYSSSRSGLMVEQYFGDMTGDGLPEWVLALGGVGTNHLHLGWLYVIQWQDGLLVDVAPDYEGWDYREMVYDSPAGGGGGVIPYLVTIDYEDIDGNGTIEVLIQREHTDSWGCAFDSTRIFMWNGSQFERVEDIRDFEDSPQCALRQARDLTWEGDYQAAIPFYEQSLELFSTHEFPDDATQGEIASWRSRQAYTAVHLALAYAMTGQPDAASRVLETIELPRGIEPIPQLVDSARASFVGDQRVFDLCVAMYETFETYHRESPSAPNPYWGHTLDVPLAYSGGGGVAAPPPDATKAGCDAGALLTTLTADVNFITDESPIAQLNALGITVDQYHTFDINSDGHDDWFIWFGQDVRPMILLSDDDHYLLPDARHLPYPDTDTEVFDWQLPDGTPALLFYNYDTRPSVRRQNATGSREFPYRRCPLEESDTEFPRGAIFLWWLDTEAFDYSRHEFCEPMSIEQIFPDGSSSQTLNAWGAVYDGGRSSHVNLQPTVFQWDDVTRRYRSEDAIQAASVTPTPIPTSAPEVATYSLFNGFQDGDYAGVVSNADSLIANFNAETEDDVRYRILYYRAMALEALNRTEEALAQYIVIYEAAPDSAWGMLAALHLEPVTVESQ